MNIHDLERLPRNVARMIEPVPPTTCWIYTGAVNSAGYGTASVQTTERWLVHRLSYTKLVGPIPKGMTIDHLCRVKLCVNPDHMEVVSHRENNLRGNSMAARWARRTHCGKCGRELGPINNHRKRGCGHCWAAYMREYGITNRDRLREARRLRKARAAKHSPAAAKSAAER